MILDHSNKKKNNNNVAQLFCVLCVHNRICKCLGKKCKRNGSMWRTAAVFEQLDWKKPAGDTTVIFRFGGSSRYSTCKIYGKNLQTSGNKHNNRLKIAVQILVWLQRLLSLPYASYFDFLNGVRRTTRVTDARTSRAMHQTCSSRRAAASGARVRGQR